MYPRIPFERRYLLVGTALTTIDALPDLIQASLGGTFLAYLHVVFEAMGKARAPISRASQGD